MANLSNIITPTNVLTATSTNTLTNKTINGASNTITNIPLTSAVTGTLPVAQGGTGAATLTANNVLLGNGTSAVQVVAPGTAGNVLTSNGTTWQSTTPAPSAGSITATASGAITIGDATIINSDGTVSTVTATVNTSSNWAQLSSGTDTTSNNAYNGNPAFSWDPVNAIAVLWYRRSSNSNLCAKAMRFSPTTGTWTVGPLFDSGTVTSYIPSAVFCSNSGGTPLHACGIIDTSANLWVFPVTVNTSTLAISNQGQALPINTVNPNLTIGYNAAVNRVLVQVYWSAGGDNILTSLQVNSNATLNANGGFTYFIDGSISERTFTYEPTSQRSIFLCRPSSNSNYVTAYVITFSGSGNVNTTLSSPTTVTTTSYSGTAFAVNAIGSSQIAVVAGFSAGVGLIAGTVSGTSITWGSLVYAGVSNNILASTYPLTGSSTKVVQSAGYYQSFTLSGNTITLGGSAYTVNSGASPTVMFYSDASEVTTINAASNGTINGFLNTPFTTTLTSSNFLGFSAGTYANGATATINVVGSTNNSRSGMTAGTKYYVGVTGGLNTVPSNPYAGVALSSTRILVKG